MYKATMFLLALLLLPASSVVPEDVGFEKMFHDNSASVNECHDVVDLPSHLNGSFIISSGGKFGMGDTAFVGAFDVFGKMHAFDFSTGKICYRAEMMMTGFYNDSKKKNTVGHGILFKETSPPRKGCGLEPMCNTLAPNDNTFVNTLRLTPPNSPPIYCSLTDTSTWRDFDPATLGQFKKHKWKDHVPEFAHIGALGPAHPKARPGHAGQFISVTQQVPMKSPNTNPEVTVFKLDSADPYKRQTILTYKPDFLPYFHSFGLLEDSALLIHQPVTIDFKVLEKVGLLGKAFKNLQGTTPPTYNKFFLVPLDNNVKGATPRVFNSTEQFFHLHTINTYRNKTDNTIVVDCEIYSDFPYNDNTMTLPGIRSKSVRDKYSNWGQIKRYRLSEATGMVSVGEDISASGSQTAFPRCNPNYSGKPYCFYWGVEMFHNKREYGSYAIVKKNICTGEKIYWGKPNHMQSEATFVPKPGGAEDEGSLILVDFDGVAGKSSLVTIDAQTMETVTSTELSEFVPFMLHGEWYDRL